MSGNQPKGDDDEPPIVVIINPKVKAFIKAAVKSPEFWIGCGIGALVIYVTGLF